MKQRISILILIQIALLLLIFCLAKIAFADTYQSPNPDVMGSSSLKKRISVSKEPDVVVDRHVLGEADWRNDPSIHYKGPKKKEENNIVYLTKEVVKVVYLPQPKNEEVKITSQFCDDNSCSQPMEQK